MRPLTYILLFIFMTCGFTLAGAVTVTGRTIELTEAEAKACADEGGCVIMSNAYIEQIVAVIELLQRQAKGAKDKSCA